MLDAGVSVFRSLSTDLLRGLTAGRVADEAGFHRQTFYRYWDTQAEYVDELIRHLLSTEARPTNDKSKVVPDRPAPTSPAELAHDVAQFDFERVRSDPSVAMRVGLVAMRALHGEVRTGLAQAYYDASASRLADVYSVLVDHWGREWRPPFGPRELARVHQGLLLGLVLQDASAVDEPTAAALFEISLVPIMTAMTIPRGEESA